MSQDQISHGEAAGVYDTASPDYQSPLQSEIEGQVDPLEDLERLSRYLLATFPDEVNRTNVQVPETPVDIAIRLLQGLSASVPPTQQERCTEQYCNKPLGHTDNHGWMHRQ